MRHLLASTTALFASTTALLASTTDIATTTTLAMTSMLVVTGCSDGARPNDSSSGVADSGDVAHPSSTADSGGSADSSAGAAAGPDWEIVRDSFGLLTTLAGSGKSDSGNEWQPTFEGGPAIQAELSRPHMAMADDAGNVYIADKEGHGIRKVALDHTIRTVAGTSVAGNAPDVAMNALDGALSNPNGLWVRGDGTFYILDLDNAKVRRVTADGQMSTLFSLDSIPIGRGLWVAHDESEAFVAAGTRLLHWSPSAGVGVYADGFSSLGMVVKTEDGRVLVGDRGAHRVFEVATDGAKTAVAGNGATGHPVDGALALNTAFEEPRAIWPYKEGLLVGLHNACRLLYVDSAGVTHVLLQGTSTTHAGDGQLYDPRTKTIGEMRSVTAMRNGDVLFVEGDAGFVRVLQVSAR